MNSKLEKSVELVQPATELHSSYRIPLMKLFPVHSEQGTNIPVISRKTLDVDSSVKL